jgi:hypothetical protein
MDKQLEQKIRERAYELWMQHGSLPGRAEEYWYQAEQEIMGGAEAQTAGEVGGDVARDVSVSSAPEDEEQTSVDVSPSPLGMTSETSDEILSAPAATKTRKRRSAAPALSTEGGDTAGATPKRRRSSRTP